MSARLPSRTGFGPCSLLVSVLAFAACQHTRPTLHDLDYPGRLLSPATLPFEIVWQQRVTASWREGPQGEQKERSFDAVIQRRGDQLLVLGLSPMGSVGFSIALDQHGAIAIENHLPEPMVIPPRFILLDVQRAYFPWLPAGQLEGDVGEEHVTERRADGRLLERTFVRRDGQPAGAITVHCTWGESPLLAPSRVVLDNGWFGYQLTIDTHTETRLDDVDRHGEPQ